MPTPIKIKSRLTAISRWADDVFKLDFAVEKKHARFRPGQFLHLTLNEFDPTQAYWPESRVFSICSAPRTDALSIIYSVKGSYTRRMSDEMREGEEYWLKLPYGDFIIDQLVPAGETAVLIAGGTGISPYVAFIEHGLEVGFSQHVYLAYAVRSSDRLVFPELLQRAHASEAIRLRVWSELANSGSDVITDAGRLDIDAIVNDVAEMPTPHYLLSGPPAMLEQLRNRLIGTYGVDQNTIHVDEWE